MTIKQTSNTTQSYSGKDHRGWTETLFALLLVSPLGASAYAEEIAVAEEVAVLQDETVEVDNSAAVVVLPEEDAGDFTDFGEEGDADDVSVFELQEFTVTGSRIERLDMETIAPVTRITAEELSQSGLSVEDKLRTMPLVSGQSFNSTDSSVSFAPGVSSINLRGLGNNNTLLLINGRRATPFPTAGGSGFQMVVDLGSVPSAAIGSVDVVKDGASAIYGSDAVAGVIAYNLVDYYDGITTQVSYGDFVDEGRGYEQRTASFIGGTRVGDLDILVVADYQENEQVFARDIDYVSTADLTRFHPAADFRSTATPSATISGSEFINDPTNTSALARSLSLSKFDTNGNGTIDFSELPEPNPVQTGAMAGGLPAQPSFSDTDFVDTNVNGYPQDGEVPGVPRYDFQEEAGYFPRNQRLGFYSRLSYDLTENINLYSELSYRRREGEIHAAPTPIRHDRELPDTTDPNLDPQGLVLPADNPNNILGRDLRSLNWRMVQLGNRVTEVVSESPRVLVGAEFDELFGGDWNMDTGFVYSRPTTETYQTGFALDDRTQEALDGWDHDGNAATAPLYLNPFGLSDPRVYDYISEPLEKADVYELFSYDLTLAGPVFEAFNRTINGAFGLEHRNESLYTERDEPYTNGNIISGSEQDEMSGERDVTSFYAEIEIPVFEQLELQLALRHEQYSDFGDTTKPKVAFKYRPNDWMLIRASYSESFRAPDLPFLYQGRTAGFTRQELDVRRQYISPTTGGFVFADAPEQIKVISQGNPDLKPEETDTMAVGAVFDLKKHMIPFDFVKDLTVEFGYWEYDQVNLIERGSHTDILRRELQASLQPGDDPSSRFSILGQDNDYRSPEVVRAATETFLENGVSITLPGRILSVDTSTRNAGRRFTRGWDFTVNSLFDAGQVGHFGVRLDGTYTTEVKYQSSDASLASDLAGAWSRPKLRFSLSSSWNKDDWAASVTSSYTGGYRASNSAFPDVESYWRSNVQFSYLGFENTTITVGMNNVFDKRPPVDLDASPPNGVNSGVYDVTPQFAYIRWKRDW